MTKLIRCVDCNAVTAVTPFDQVPEYEKAATENGYWAIKRNDRADFESQHRGHRKEELTIIAESVHSTGVYLDPLQTTYMEATNNHSNEKFLIKRWRKSIAEPLRYDLLEGRLEVKKSIEVQKDHLKKQIFWEINTPHLSETKIAWFIAIVQEEASRIDTTKITQELYETDDPGTRYLPLHDRQIDNILTKIKRIFTKEEWQMIVQFVNNNREWDGVMSLVVKKKVAFYPQPSSKPAEAQTA